MDKKKIVIVITFVICLLSACAVFGSHLLKEKVESSIKLMQTVDKQEVKEMVNTNLSEETALKLRDSWTVALFGLDSRESNGLTGTNSDVIMLLTLNGRTGDIKLVSVYRDTCLKTGSGSYKKANSAYLMGGPKQAVAMLNENLDLKIDDYAALNWKGVADAVNILGGIDLEITPEEFKYINSFITETVESTGIASFHLEKAGMNHLDGVQTVAYCRLRLMDNDFKRTERQRKVLEILMNKAAHTDFARLDQLITTILPQMSSSIDAEDLYAVAGNILKLQKPETQGFPSENFCKTVDGVSYVFPDTLESNVKALHKFLYGSEQYEPSYAVKEISAAVNEKSTGKKRENISDEKKNEKNEEIKETEAIIMETQPQEAASAEGRITGEVPEETVPEETNPSAAQIQESFGPGYIPEETETAGNAVVEAGIAKMWSAENTEIGPGVKESEGDIDVYME